MRFELNSALAIGCWTSLALSGAAAELAELEQRALNSAVERVADSVVQIRTVGGLDVVDEQIVAQGPTTGLVITGDGYIISSAINFAQRPSSVLVRLPGGKQQPAEIVGRDDNRMLVLLKVESDEPLPVPEAAPSDELRPGDWSVAIGRTYQSDRVSVSVGVVSALNRMHGRVIQTDANVSASNYGGPLVDVRGRVLGVLVPMSPESAGAASETSAMAGAEYYDSGIGFAVPLEHILNVLPRWIHEKDLKRGVLGVGLKPGSPHSTPPTITAVWPESPAAEAGWKPKDRIVRVEDVAVNSQTELRFQIIPRYAGDSLKVMLRRGRGKKTREIETTVSLADELPPFRHAFLGVLPATGSTMPESDKEQANADGEADDSSSNAAGSDEKEPGANDDESTAGVLIRAVWPGSPAEKIGLKAGDRITQLGEEKVQSLPDAVAEVNAKYPGDKLSITAVRGDDQLKLDAELDVLPTDILSIDELPPRAEVDADDSSAAPKLEEFKLPEMSQTARFFAPADDGPARGLLLWLGDGRPESTDALAAAWQRACRRDRLVLLLPSPGDEAGWSTDDMEYLGRLLQTAMSRFGVDPRRVVIAGEGRAGQLAYALAFKGRQLVRGVAVVDSPLPRTLELPDNNPDERLAVLSIETENAPLSLVIRKDLGKLEEAGYPVTQLVRRGEDARDAALDGATRAKIARWVDGLDRF